MNAKRRVYTISPHLPEYCSRCGNVKVCGDPGHCPHGYGNDKKGKGRRQRAAPLEQHRRGVDVHPMSQGLIVADRGRATFILQDAPRVEVRVSLVDWGKRGIVLEVMSVQTKLVVLPLTANQILIDSNGD